VDKWAKGPANFVASSNLVLADLSVRLDEYWAALTTVLVVVALPRRILAMAKAQERNPRLAEGRDRAS
jgi:hypothetical protein